MAKQRIQSLVKAIVSDSGLRARFSNDPESVMAGYRLTTGEKKVILSSRMKTALTAGNSTVVADSVLDNWF